MDILKFEHNKSTISLRALEGIEEEFVQLSNWLTDPDILEFYEGRDKNFSYEEIKSKYGKKIELENIFPCMIMFDGKYIGYLQYFLIPKEGEWRYSHFEIEYKEKMFSIDLFIGEKEYWGKGIGSTLFSIEVAYTCNCI